MGQKMGSNASSGLFPRSPLTLVASSGRSFQGILVCMPDLATKLSRQAGTGSGEVGTTTFSASSGLAVAQTLLVAIMRY